MNAPVSTVHGAINCWTIRCRSTDLLSIQHGVTDEGGAKYIGHGWTKLILIANQSEGRTSLIFTNLGREKDHRT